jgi:hypothetical protein
MNAARRTGVLGVSLLGSVLILAASCGDPDKAGDDGTGAVAGAPAGDAGEASAGGTAQPGTGGSSQAGTDTGAAGAAAAAPGGASSCGAAPDPTPTLPAAAELDADAVARAAAVLGSCVPDDGVDRNAAHLWTNDIALSVFFYRHAAQLDCLANAACGCEAIRHCTGFHQGVTDEACQASCDDGVFRACGEEDGMMLQYTLACGNFGLACDVDGACIDVGAQPCDEETAPSCDGDRFVGCRSGSTTSGPECQSLGLTCGANGCQGTGAQCSDFGDAASEQEIPIAGSACDGDDLVACVNGAVATIDCAARGPGFSCQNMGESFFCGLGSACLPASSGAPSDSHPPVCDGDVLVFCNAGRLEQLDCTTLGFSGCGTLDVATRFGCVP